MQAVVKEVSDALVAEGRSQAWQVFRRRAIDGVTIEALEGEKGLKSFEIHAMLKLVSRRLRQQIEVELRREGVSEASLRDAAAQALRTSIGESFD